MAGWRALALVGLLCVPVGSADWLQEGGDARHTAFNPQTGPAWPDVALRLGVDAHINDNAPAAPLLVIGDRAFFVTQDTIVSSLNLSTAEVTPFWQGSTDAASCTASVGACARSIHALASDGQRLFAASGGAIFALDLASGSLLWPNDPPLVSGGCSKVAVAEGVVYSACQSARGYALGDLMTVQAQDAATGAAVWDAPYASVAPFGVGTGLGRTIDGLGVVGGFVYLTYHDGFDAAGTSVPEDNLPQTARSGLHVIGRSSGQGQAWMTTGTQARDGLDWTAVPTSDGAALWVRIGRALYTASADNPIPTTSPTNVYPLVRYELAAAPSGNRADGLAFDGGSLYVAYSGTLWAFPPEVTSPRWRFDLPPGVRWLPGPIVVDEAAVHARPSDGSLYSIVKQTGEVEWVAGLGLETIAPGSDRLVGLVRGSVVVLGHAAYALHPAFSTPNAYPNVQQEVKIDLSHTLASPQGPPSFYAVDWGLGEPLQWSTSPHLSHRYGTEGDYAARAYVRNDAGQTGSAPFLLHVGAHDPAVNIINSPLANEYQNQTFFVLGLLATALVGLFGIARAGRKRRLFQRELRHLEEDHKRLHADAGATEAMLSERRTAARALFLDRRLDETHASFLERRIDEMRQGLRFSAVEQRLDFLPMGMVKALREMLRDTRVTEWERNSFIDALDRDRLLTADQKRQVRDLIESWFARDAGQPS